MQLRPTFSSPHSIYPFRTSISGYRTKTRLLSSSNASSGSGSREREGEREGQEDVANSSSDNNNATTTSTTSTNDMSASDRLFLDALREESSSSSPQKSQYLQYLESQHLQGHPNWDGDERMEDTVLRMLVDKYKPLRNTGGGIKSADEKLKERVPKITPKDMALDLDGVLERFTRNANVGSDATTTATSTITTTTTATQETTPLTPSSISWADEPLLPSSDSHRPWHTEFRVPSHVISSIKLANIPLNPLPPHLRDTSTVFSSPPFGGGGTGRTTKGGDDEKARKKEKEMKKRSEMGNRLGKAREETLDYRLGLKDKAGALGIAAGMRPNPVSMKGWAGLIEDKIERARSRGVFNNLKGRGQPLSSTLEEKNPFIAREEFLMNRIVQRNGAAPPWVELQGELDTALQSFRSILRASYVRRTIRLLTSLHPPYVLSKYTLPDILSHRDPEWEKKEESYHTKAVDEINALVRKYNGLAPYAVRRAYIMKKVEVERVYEECAEDVLEGLKGRLKAGDGGVGIGAAGAGDGEKTGGAGATGGRADDPEFMGLGDWIWGLIGKVLGRWRVR
ncbi:hypothetical protein VKT23_001491 [Stygiomarasmius scandens]|uniref:DnaJ homologue subfamily C member 28 conserved domain-containing protein n=1 Tax=Marasmiellus scandens TaxID=2682957 RepID=A0ABR1JZ05_9AGAR